MDWIDMLEEAEKCRRQALSYVGKPEAPFLLRLAKEFDSLNSEKRKRLPRHDQV
jgi:hypothetical protein